MAFQRPGGTSLDYFPCRYGESRLTFRGPRRLLSGDYIAAFGGSETFGSFVADPWPALLESRLGLPVVNFGCLNAGAEIFAQENALAEIGCASRVAVVQLVGAPNQSNDFYSVHPRRNDRFLIETARMRALFPEVDFTEFAFVRHMLVSLGQRDPAAFRTLIHELQACWLQKMTGFIARLDVPVVLLWLDNWRPVVRSDPLGPEPHFVTRAMVERLVPEAAALVRVEPMRPRGATQMHFRPPEAPAAAVSLWPEFHEEIAEALAPALRPLA